MKTMKTFTYKKCTIEPETLAQSILVGCNNSVNRYLKTVWRIIFPDRTWCRVGTKLMAQQYINSKGHSHGAL